MSDPIVAGRKLKEKVDEALKEFAKETDCQFLPSIDVHHLDKSTHSDVVRKYYFHAHVTIESEHI